MIRLFMVVLFANLLLSILAVWGYQLMKGIEFGSIPTSELSAFAECARRYIKDCAYGPAVTSFVSFRLLSLETLLMPMFAVPNALVVAKVCRRARPNIPMLIIIFAVTPLLSQWLFSWTAQLPSAFLSDRWHASGMQNILTECIELSKEASCQAHRDWLRRMSWGAAALRHINDVAMFLYSMLAATIVTVSTHTAKKEGATNGDA